MSLSFRAHIMIQKKSKCCRNCLKYYMQFKTTLYSSPYKYRSSFPHHQSVSNITLQHLWSLTPVDSILYLNSKTTNKWSWFLLLRNVFINTASCKPIWFYIVASEKLKTYQDLPKYFKKNPNLFFQKNIF